MSDFDAADIREVRREGGMADLMRLQIAVGLGRRNAKPMKPVPPQPPDHKPGAWPAGCERPQPPPPQPREAWLAAVAVHRAWLAAGSPPGDFRCGCGCTSFDDDTPRSSQ